MNRLPDNRRADLLDEALAARTPEKVARLVREDADQAARSVATVVTLARDSG